MAVSSPDGAPLDATLPDVTLDAPDGTAHRLHDLAGDGPTLVAFVCNHCPYVQHVEVLLGELATAFAARGVTTVGVVSNDLVTYPQDGPDGIREQAARAGWTFPVLLDRDHALAHALGAVCTPDLFLFDADGRLAHRGGLDTSTPGNGEPLTGADLRAALDAVLTGAPVPDGLAPSLGCGIKWAEGHEPA